MFHFDDVMFHLIHILIPSPGVMESVRNFNP